MCSKYTILGAAQNGCRSSPPLPMAPFAADADDDDDDDEEEVGDDAYVPSEL